MSRSEGKFNPEGFVVCATEAEAEDQARRFILNGRRARTIRRCVRGWNQAKTVWLVGWQTRARS